MKKVVGYTTGVFDLFHIGHLNILEQAKKHCDYLIVGVTTDEEAYRLKNVKPFIPFEERYRIVKSIKYVDEVVPEKHSDKLLAWSRLGFNVIFKGSDWQGTELWNRYGLFFSNQGVKVHFIDYTKGTSSTELRKFIKNYR